MPAYSDGLSFIWHFAALEAVAGEHATIKPGHFFIALAKTPDLPLGELEDAADAEVHLRLPAITAEIDEIRCIFAQVGLDIVRFRRRLRGALGNEGERAEDDVVHRSPEVRRLCDRADRLSGEAGAREVRPVHLLWALCEQEDVPWRSILTELGIDRTELLRAAEAAGRTATALVPQEAVVGRSGPAPDHTSRTPLLDRYGRDLTPLATEGRLPPVIGRREEIRRLGQVLLQQRRNNAILVGEPGVGKTCVVEGLAQRLAGEKVSEEFRGRRIVDISLVALVAGTKYRGEFEERLQGVLAEAAGNPEIILFIDEIHLMVGAGAAEGSMDAANIMKPALARGEICCIGATTTREYRQYIEKDSALERRFQVIWVEEPTRVETLEILRGLQPSFEEHHHASIDEAALAAAVDLSMRYNQDQRLPDKAIDLVDEACARTRLQTFSNLAPAARIGRPEIARVVASRYRIPLDTITEDEGARLAQLEALLRRRVKGQDEAIATVSEVVRMARAGLKPPNRPQGVFLFVGPTGTGKTELAKSLAETLFGAEDRLVRLDMSEYAERHTVSKLIGAPPGYVGYEEEGVLSAAVRSHPYAVVLLDEIEKAHPDIHKLFLQVFDDGRLTDSHGRRVSFTETLLIMTSNLGTGLPEVHPLGFGAREDRDAAQSREHNQERVLQAVRETLTPEFLNRIHRILCFNLLTPEAVREIIDKILDALRAQLAPRNITFELDDSAYAVLMAQGYDETYGARAMERTVSRLLAEPLSRQIITDEIANGTRVRVYGDGDNLYFECLTET